MLLHAQLRGQRSQMWVWDLLRSVLLLRLTSSPGVRNGSAEYAAIVCSFLKETV